jgi:hypothetical protein
MATQSEGTGRVREYLLSQGEKYSFRDLWVRVTQARLELLKAIDGVTDEEASFRPDDVEWSILEVLDHLLASSAHVVGLVEALANGRERSPGPVEAPPNGTESTLDEMRGLLLKDSVAWAALPERLPEPPSFEVLARHPAFGRLHARAWYLFQRIHDLDHTDQIRKNREAPGYPSG